MARLGRVDLDPFRNPMLVRVELSVRRGEHRLEAPMFELAKKYTRLSEQSPGGIESYYRGTVRNRGDIMGHDDNRYCVRFTVHNVFYPQLKAESRLYGIVLEDIR